MAGIHPSAIIEPGATLGEGCEIGPFCLVGPRVTLGDRVVLKSHVVVTGDTSIGDDTVVFPFAVIGEIPQDLKFRGEETRLIVGARNRIREHVTMNTGTTGGGSVAAAQPASAAQASKPRRITPRCSPSTSPVRAWTISPGSTPSGRIALTTLA